MGLIEIECEECGCLCTQNADGTLTPVPQTGSLPSELVGLIRQAQGHMLRTPEADAVSVKLTQYLLNAGA